MHLKVIVVLYFVFIEMIPILASCLKSQVSILLAIELIWNLCEVLFIDAAPGKNLTLCLHLNSPFMFGICFIMLL